jgi:hypothetical protein
METLRGGDVAQERDELRVDGDRRKVVDVVVRRLKGRLDSAQPPEDGISEEDVAHIPAAPDDALDVEGLVALVAVEPAVHSDILDASAHLAADGDAGTGGGAAEVQNLDIGAGTPYATTA